MKRAQTILVILALVCLLVAIVLGLISLGIDAGLWLDQRFRETRFVASHPGQLCPLAWMTGDQATPMCRPPNGSW